MQFEELQCAGVSSCLLEGCIAYGPLETPEFQRQSRDSAAAVKAAGRRVQLLVGKGYNHFEIPETLGNPHGLLGRAMLAQMGLS